MSWSKFEYQLQTWLERGLDQRLRLAVTGLSRAGKTAFISALVYQLRHFNAQQQLPLLKVAREGRLLGCKRTHQPDLSIPRFPYDQALAALYSQPPYWPQPTNGISEICLDLRYRPQTSLKRYLGEVASLQLEIVDYPGEWLLDLPLLEQDFITWSQTSIAYLQQHPQRRALAQAWWQGVEALDVLAPADEQKIAQLAALYTENLHQSKAAGFAWIQPGRFIMPADHAGAPILEFFPLPQLAKYSAEQIHTAAPDSLFALLQQRFEYYKNHLVRPFYKEHFSRFDRQIVLIDLLQALNAGHEKVLDTQMTLTQLLQSFRYGQRDFLRRLFAPRIDRLLFAITKSDHVTRDQDPALCQLLQNLLQDPLQDLRTEAVQLQIQPLASVRATQELTLELSDGQKTPALKGRNLQGEALTFYPGEVPKSLPAPAFWQTQGFEFMHFAPPSLHQEQALPHLRMDEALEFLLGDRLT